MTEPDLSSFTTLGVGGPATNFLHVKSEAELIAAVKSADDSKTPLLILGGGSNVLISDSGFAGTVVRVETTGNSYEIDACSGGTLTVSAGSDWDEFVAFTIEEGLANLESLSGIPGTIGGAPIQNIGAYGHEVSEVIARVRTYDRTKQEIKTFMASECNFSYRSSIFKESAGRYVILDVTFQLRKGEQSLPIGYAELANELGVEIGARVEISKVREAVLKLRGAKGMLVGQGINSAGSFFMNPILKKDIADKLPSDAPRWPMPDGRVKTSAAWLMEHAGVSKGDRLAGAQISPKHVLALSNSGDATAKDLIELARSAQEKVKAKFGIELQSEVQLVGLSL
ncbi:MurB UDP-N-acetylmuramate dehydrogenase [actinobacterium SCGC AAA044-D11]